MSIFFVLLLLVIWATSIWVEPVGPTYYNVAWLPITLVGLVFFILLLSVTPRRPRDISVEKELSVEEREQEKEAAATFGGVMLFFWIFIIAMAAIVVIGYLV